MSTSFLSKLFINPFEPDSCKFVSLYTLLTDLCPALVYFLRWVLVFLFSGPVNELGPRAFAM